LKPKFKKQTGLLNHQEKQCFEFMRKLHLGDLPSGFLSTQVSKGQTRNAIEDFFHKKGKSSKPDGSDDELICSEESDQED